jgi:hypothetical protein
VQGLNLDENDSVLAICGSGDQAFAFCEKARRVVAIDLDNSVLRYAKSRVDNLIQGNCENFFIPSSNQLLRPLIRKNLAYFLDIDVARISENSTIFELGVENDRPKSIISNVPSIEFVEINLIDAIEKIGCDHNKVYLSNAVDWLYYFEQKKDGSSPEKVVAELFDSLCQNLSKGTIIYCTDGSSKVHRDIEKLGCVNSRRIEERSWSPIIYEVI